MRMTIKDLQLDITEEYPQSFFSNHHFSILKNPYYRKMINLLYIGFYLAKICPLSDKDLHLINVELAYNELYMIYSEFNIEKKPECFLAWLNQMRLEVIGVNADLVHLIIKEADALGYCTKHINNPLYDNKSKSVYNRFKDFILSFIF